MEHNSAKFSVSMYQGLLFLLIPIPPVPHFLLMLHLEALSMSTFPTKVYW
jgi:hypothetical protein